MPPDALPTLTAHTASGVAEHPGVLLRVLLPPRNGVHLTTLF